MAVTVAGSTARTTPSRKRAAPTPPHRTTTLVRITRTLNAVRTAVTERRQRGQVRHALARLVVIERAEPPFGERRETARAAIPVGAPALDPVRSAPRRWGRQDAVPRATTRAAV